MEQYHIVKSRMCFRSYFLKLSEVRTIIQNPNQRVAGGVLHVAKTKTIRKWELNTSHNFMNLKTEDFFVGRCHRNKYAMWKKYYQKIYIQEEMYNALYKGYLKGDANSHLFWSLWNDVQYLHNCPRKYGGESEWKHMCLLKRLLGCFHVAVDDLVLVG